MYVCCVCVYVCVLSSDVPSNCTWNRTRGVVVLSLLSKSLALEAVASLGMDDVFVTFTDESDDEFLNNDASKRALASLSGNGVWISPEVPLRCCICELCANYRTHSAINTNTYTPCSHQAIGRVSLRR